MRDLFFILAGKVVNGLIGIVLFSIIKDSLFPAAYINFSYFFAILTLISTFSSGAIGGLMLKRCFNLKNHNHVIIQWVAFFLLISAVTIEIFIASKSLPSMYRLQAYGYLMSNIFITTILIEFQLKQEFLKMAFTDSFRMIIPLVILVINTYMLQIDHISVGQILWILVIGNIVGFFQFILKISFEPNHLKDFSYLRENWRSDLLFSFWFSAFNSTAQLILTVDRKMLSGFYNPLSASTIAYTGDQVTRIVNGLVFPINTKISSKLGKLIKENELDKFNQYLTNGALLSLITGLLLAGALLFGMLIAPIYNIPINFNTKYTTLYAIGTTLYLAAIIWQKSFDYTQFKSIPTLLLLLSGYIAYVMVGNTNLYQYGLYFCTNILFFCMINGARLGLRSRLKMDK